MYIEDIILPIIIVLLIHAGLCGFIAEALPERTNKKFVWMLFFGIPVGLIIASLLDISDALNKTPTQTESVEPLPITEVDVAQNEEKEAITTQSEPMPEQEMTEQPPSVEGEKEPNKVKEVISAVVFLILIGGISFGGGALLHLIF